MKLLHVGVCLALFVCLEGAEVGKIRRLIPVEDWMNLKRRTVEIKPLEKWLGKLRATYDLVFHKGENVSNVEKILTETRENESTEKGLKNGPSNIAMIERRKSIEDRVSEELEESKKQLEDEMNSWSMRNRSSDWLGEKFEKLSNMDNLDETFELEHIEICPDENSSDLFDEEFENSANKNSALHSKFALPYAIAQALMRWIISLYLSTSNHLSNINIGTKETA